MDITLKISSAAKELIAKAGFDEKYCARPLKRAIQTKVEDALAQEILEGKVKAGDKVLLGVSKEEIKFSVKVFNSYGIFPRLLSYFTIIELTYPELFHFSQKI